MDLVSVIIPSRNEKYLYKTVFNVLATAKEDIEIFILLDAWDFIGYNDKNPEASNILHEQVRLVKELASKNKCVKIIETKECLGQRRFINEAVRQSKGKYFLKIDAHSMMSANWDIAAKKAMERDVFLIPQMWKLDEQSWKPVNKNTQYHLDNNLTPRTGGGFINLHKPELMAFGGEAWFVSINLWWKLGGYDEMLGNWGSTGTEFSLKVWLMGYKLLLCDDFWCAHLYRGKFPYKDKGMRARTTGKIIRSNFLANRVKGQIHPVEWLVNKFWPIPTWDINTILEIRKKYCD